MDDEDEVEATGVEAAAEDSILTFSGDAPLATDAASAESEADVTAPLDASRARVSAKDWTVETIVQRMRKGRVDLNPKFRRRVPWTDQTKRITERGELGDRAYALVDPSNGKVASAKDPRKWGEGVLHLTDRTLAQTIESITGVPPHLDVADQWRLTPPIPWLSPPLSPQGEVLARCTSYRMGSVRLSRNISYVDLARIDPAIGALLEATQLNLGQLFADPRIEKFDFEFGTDETAGEIDEVFRKCFPDELHELYPYVWRRYQAAIDGAVTFLVIEALPVSIWKQLLDLEPAPLARKGTSR